MADRLYRSREDRMLAGVAAGVADALDADPSIVRVAWALLTIFTGGVALVVYIVMAIVVPEEPGAALGGTPDQPTTGPESASLKPGIGVAPPSSSSTDDRAARRAERRARRSSADSGRAGLIGGVVLIIIGGIFLIREFVPWFDWRLWWPVGLIGLGLLLLVLALRPNRPPE